MRSTRRADQPGLIGDVAPINERRMPWGLWTYEPRGPVFTVEWVNHDTPTVAGAEAYDSLDHAILRFSEIAIPQWHGYHWHVVDQQRTVVLGYALHDSALHNIGPFGAWCGVRAAYDVLTRLHDPMEVAIWETMAKEAACGR